MSAAAYLKWSIMLSWIHVHVIQKGKRIHTA